MTFLSSRIGERDLSPYFVRALDDSEPGIRKRAVAALVTSRRIHGRLSALGDEELVARLERMADADPDADVRLAAANGLLQYRREATADAGDPRERRPAT